MHFHSTSLILIDLDYFKAVNDTFGHDVGDQVLMHVADFLSANVRKQDLIARWGGEEFVILLRDTSIEQSEQIATNLQEKMTLENFSPVTSMTFSAGVATLSAGQSFDDLIANADKALYTAKKSGRNCVKSWVCV